MLSGSYLFRNTLLKFVYFNKLQYLILYIYLCSHFSHTRPQVGNEHELHLGPQLIMNENTDI